MSNSVIIFKQAEEGGSLDKLGTQIIFLEWSKFREKIGRHVFLQSVFLWSVLQHNILLDNEQQV